MDYNLLCFLIAVSASASVVVRLLLTRRSDRYWLAVQIAALLAEILLFVFVHGVGGYWALVPFSAWIALPAWLLRRYQRATLRQEYRTAERVARFLAFWTRGREFTHNARLLSILRLWQAGSEVEARARLEAYGREQGAPATARAIEQRLVGDWQAFLASVDENASLEPSRFATHVRALGETGRYAQMLALLARADRAARLQPQERNLARLYGLSFLGQQTAVELLLSGGLRHLHPGVAALWRATCAAAGGRMDEAEAELGRAERHAEDDHLLRRSIVQRRSSLLALHMHGEAVDENLLRRVVRTLELEHRYSLFGSGARRWMPITSVLIFVNLVGFAAELLLGGSTDPEVLLQLGALVPSEVLESAWWRLVPWMFLHFGVGHLALNMVALAFFGARFERVSGALATLFIYFGSGLFAAAAEIADYSLRGEFSVMVGASASVLGLLGGRGLHLWRISRTEHLPAAKRELLGIFAAIATQLASDPLIGTHAALAHGTGFLGGFLLCALLPAPPSSARSTNGAGARNEAVARPSNP